MSDHQLPSRAGKIQKRSSNAVLHQSVWVCAGAVLPCQHIAVPVASKPLATSCLVNHRQLEPSCIGTNLRLCTKKLRRGFASVRPVKRFTRTHRAWNPSNLKHILNVVRQWFRTRLVSNQVLFQLSLVTTASCAIGKLEQRGAAAQCFLRHSKAVLSVIGGHQKLHSCDSGFARLASANQKSTFPQNSGARAI